MGNFIESILKAATSVLLRPITLFSRQIKKNLFLKSRVVTAVKASMKSFLAVLKRKPAMKSDYVLVGDQYYAKRLLMLVFLLVVAIITLSTTVLVPLARGRLFTPTFALSDPDLATYSGRAKLINRANILVYNGQMAAGLCEGTGKLYDDTGKLVYEGQFKADAFEGEGILYDGTGQKIYEGLFAANQFHGLGRAFDEKGRIVYEGDFANGFYNGSGKRFDENGLVRYAGGFSQGLENGYGIAYFSTGNIEYNGSYLNGDYHGEGTLYGADGQKLYSGSFASGKFEGLGKRYNDNGVLIYEGFFAMGTYSGLGRAYDASGILLYEGTFLSGKYSGLGAYYQKEQKRYDGDWLDGGIVFERYLGQLSTDFKQHFLEQGSLVEMKDHYGLWLPQTGVAPILSYPDTINEPVISKIYISRVTLSALGGDGLQLEQWKKRWANDQKEKQVALESNEDWDLLKTMGLRGKVWQLTAQVDAATINAYFNSDYEMVLLEYLPK